MSHDHAYIQKRVFKIVLIAAAVLALIATPLIVLDDFRYNLALQMGLAPGEQGEKIANTTDGATLIVIPLEHDNATGSNPWLYRAQYIAWPTGDHLELENLETGERVPLPIGWVNFWSANADGSLVLIRGPLADGSGDAAIVVHYNTMTVEQLPSADSLPDAPGDWETASWDKNLGLCHRPSVERRFVGCFTRSDTASYLAGDWQFDVQIYGDYETVRPIFRGQGFIPWIGFANNDTVVYLQNELGIWRIAIPESVLEQAPRGTPYVPATPGASPVATPQTTAP